MLWLQAHSKPNPILTPLCYHWARWLMRRGLEIGLSIEQLVSNLQGRLGNAVLGEEVPEMGMRYISYMRYIRYLVWECGARRTRLTTSECAPQTLRAWSCLHRKSLTTHFSFAAYPLQAQPNLVLDHGATRDKHPTSCAAYYWSTHRPPRFSRFAPRDLTVFNGM